MRLLSHLPLLLILAPWLPFADSQGTELGGGVVTREDVEMYADLALDIRDIREATSSDAALNLYLEGRNAELQPGIKFTLVSLSNDLDSIARTPQKRSQVTPNYLYHLYGLGNRVTADFPTDAKYADSYMKQVALQSNDLSFAGETLVALHAWMYATHKLYMGIDTCQRLTSADNTATIGPIEGGGMDEFIALWIGKDQTPGSSDGHGLYSMTQRAAELFGQLENHPEAPVNTNLKTLYQEGAAALSFPNACSKDNTETVGQLWSVAQRMTSQMMIPLMQLLIDAILQQDQQRTKLYAVAVVPQISQCKPSTFKKLKESLLDGQATSSRTSDIIADLQSTYDCFGFTCSDVGAYNVDQLGECDRIPFNLPIVEYVPVTDVHDLAKIDLDILQLEILTSHETYNFAKYLYLYGRNSPRPQETENDRYTLRSLSELATSAARRAATFYNDFAEYHNNPNYAHSIIVQTLDGTPNTWGARSAAQRTEMVVKTAAYQVLYMWAMAEMADALNDCQSSNAYSNLGAAHAWDEVAAYLVGSLEGTAAGGSPDTDDGQLLWNLANQRFFQFQTKNSDGYSAINSELEDYVYAGRGELNAYDCDNLAITISAIEHLLMAPLIQSILRFAVENEGAAETSPSLAEGEAYAFAVLPIVAKYDAEAAQVIRENMEFREGVPPVQAGAQAVADAFYDGLDQLGYNCQAVGATPQVDACGRAGGIGKVRSSTSGLFPMGAKQGVSSDARSTTNRGLLVGVIVSVASLAVQMMTL